MKTYAVNIMVLAFLTLSHTLAQGDGVISGTLYAPPGGDVAGSIVIACYPTSDGCDEARSGFAEVSQGGSSAPFRITGLGEGDYLVLAWQDADGDGEMAEHELTVYAQGGTEASLITPPVQGIEVRLPGTAQTETTEAAPQLVGSWSQGTGSSVEYYNPSTGAWAPPSGSGFNYTFHPDGRYEYSGMMQTSIYACTTTIFAYQSGTFVTEEQVVMLMQDVTKFKSQDTCNEAWNYERDDPPETKYLYWNVTTDSSGSTILEVTNLVLGEDGFLDFDPESTDSIFYRD